MLLSYDDALNMASEYLNTVDNIRKFCQQHNLNYANTLRIKNNQSKTKFPNIISNILIIFGNEVTIKKICFDIKKFNHGTDTDIKEREETSFQK